MANLGRWVLEQFGQRWNGALLNGALFGRWIAVPGLHGHRQKAEIRLL